MTSNMQRNGKTGLIFGIILVIVGLIILLNKLGALNLNLKKDHFNNICNLRGLSWILWLWSKLK